MNKDFDWVTEETRQFMEKGYLDPGQTVEERVREIAAHAADILKDTLQTGAEDFEEKLQPPKLIDDQIWDFEGAEHELRCC